jgi:hypothetical protein
MTYATFSANPWSSRCFAKWRVHPSTATVSLMLNPISGMNSASGDDL